MMTKNRSDIPGFVLPTFPCGVPLYTEISRSRRTYIFQSRGQVEGVSVPICPKVHIQAQLSRTTLASITSRNRCVPAWVQWGTNVERGVIVGGVLICVSFLLAVFLNHSAGERVRVPTNSVQLPASPQPTAAAAAVPPASPAEGGSPECRALAATRSAGAERSALIDEQCPATKP